MAFLPNVCAMMLNGTAKANRMGTSFTFFISRLFWKFVRDMFFPLVVFHPLGIKLLEFFSNFRPIMAFSPLLLSFARCRKILKQNLLFLILHFCKTSAPDG